MGTLLQWLNTSVLILFMSLALLNFDTFVVQQPGGTFAPQDANLRRSVYCGIALAPVAVIFMFYALWTYIWRSRRIAERKPSARYDDIMGPIFLTVMLAGVSSATIV